MTNKEFEKQHLPTARSFVGQMAKKLVGRAGLRPGDRKDLEQELLCRLISRLDRYDEHRGSVEHFFNLVVDSSAFNLVRERLARKRRPPAPFSVNARTSRLDRLTHVSADARTSRSTDELDRFERALDVATILQQLTPAERQLAELVVQSGHRGAAEQLGVNRNKLQADLRKIRERLNHLKT